MALEHKLTTQLTVERLAAQIKTDFAKKSEVQTVANNLSTVSGQVTTLVGNDSDKSVRTIANEELATQLIPENAAESLDTLQEIAAWIQEHPGDASSMNAAITALQNKLTLGTHEVEGQQVEYTTVQAYVNAAIAALNIGNYALASELTTLAGRVETLESSSTNVTASDTPGDGTIKVDGNSVTVYTLPATVLHSTDIQDYTQAEIAAMLADAPAGGGE